MADENYGKFSATPKTSERSSKPKTTATPRSIQESAKPNTKPVTSESKPPPSSDD